MVTIMLLRLSEGDVKAVLTFTGHKNNKMIKWRG